MRITILLLLFPLLSISSFAQDCPLDDVKIQVSFSEINCFCGLDWNRYCPGDYMKLLAEVDGSQEYYYQWYRNDEKIGEAKRSVSATYEVGFVSEEDDGHYEIRGYLGHPDTSTCFTTDLTGYVFAQVLEETEIVSFEVNSLKEGESGEIEVIANAEPDLQGVDYYWYHDDELIEGYSSVLQIDGDLEDRGEYYVVVNGYCGRVSSETKYLDIITGIEDKVFYNNREVQEIYNTMGQEVGLETSNETIIVKYTDGTSERIYNVR